MRALSSIAVVTALLGAMALINPPERTRFWEALFDLGHTPLFGLVALLVRGLLPAAVARRRSLWAFGATVALAVVTEILQWLQPHREPSFGDLLHDASGAGAFLLLHRAWFAPTLAPLAVAMILLAAAAWPLATVIAAYAARNAARPVLFPLDGSWWERRFLEPGDAVLTLPVRHPEAGPVLQLDLRPGPYAGIAFEEPYPDWTAFHRLVLTVISPLSAPLPVHLRVHDAAHRNHYTDRFNRLLTVQPGVNRIAVSVDDIRSGPASRELDLQRIRGIVLFVADVREPFTLFLGSIVLE